MSFKDQFKSAFEPGNESWDKEELWLDIEELLPTKENKKRPVFWWFFGCVALFFATVLVSQSSLFSSEEERNIDILNTYSLENDSMTKGTNEVKIVDKREGQNLLSSSDTQQTVGELSRGFNSNTKTEIVGEINSKIAKTNINLSKLQENKGFSRPSFNNIEAKIESKQEFIPKSQKLLTPSVLGHNNRSNLEKAFAVLPITLLKEDKSKEKKGVVLDKLPELNHSVINFSRSAVLPIPITLHLENNEENLNNEFSICFGVGLAQQSTSAYSNDYSQYAILHNASKTVREALALQAIYRRRFNSGLNLGLGLGFHRSFEWYDATYVKTTTNEIQTDSSKYYLVNGFQQFVAGNVSETRVERRNYHSPVYRNSFDIPVEVGYLFDNDRIACFSSIVFNTNVNYFHQGRVYDLSGELLQNDLKAESQLFKSKWVNSYEVGSEVRYNWTNNYAIGLGVRYRSQLGTTFVNKIEVTEQYQVWMANLSLTTRW